MTYFANIKSYEDLKEQYRTLALANHPDVGGNVETMKAINNEYDQLFPVWKHRSAVINYETAASTRNEFYTQHGFKGENYNRNISTKEIACIIREYVKDVHNDYRFSVRSEYNHLWVTMTEAPAEVFTNDKNNAQINHYNIERDDRITEEARAVMSDICKMMQSYNFDDSDSMIDYFHTNFYISLNIGAWDKPLKIVPRQKKAASFTEYETVEVIKTKTYKTLEPRDINTPEEFKIGQQFQLKSGFNYGCYRGAVYQIVNISGDGKTGFITAHKMGKGYKNVTGGTVRGTSFSCMAERLDNWIEKGAICFVELVDVTKTEEYTSSVRRPKKQTGISTEVRPAADTRTATQDTPEAAGAKEYAITEDIDTRDNSALWVVKFIDRMDREEYKQTADIMKSIKGYYSKFKKGFIFRYDPTEKLVEMFSQSAQEDTEPTAPQKQPKTSDKAATQEKISKQIDSLTAKIKALSGDYKTNTWKRMNEQAGREQKKEGYSFNIDLLTYLYNVLEQRELTTLEQALLVGAFRDEFHGYYSRHKAWTETPEEKRYSAWKAVKYPEIDSTCAEWYNKEIPQKQKRLNKAGIYNTEQLYKSIEEYANIVKEAIKPIDRTAQEIKRKENEYKLSQKGDIQFTPSDVSAQLVELAGIDSNSKVLEPSAGIGKIADEIKKVTSDIDVVEQMSGFRELLQLKGYNIVGYNFLEYKADQKYDAIIMNPPFSKNQDIQHLKHAYTMLKNGGTLVCITSPHWSFASDKASVSFRNWLDEQDCYTEDLESKTFEMTGVCSKIVVINKRVEQQEQTA